MDYFDYESVAREAAIREEDLDELRRAIRHEYPHDDMMFELHMLRACRAVRDGDITLEQALGVRMAKAA